MLDPTRFALNAETVGFRKRMGLPVDWAAFNEALQTQSDCVKVRRELEETPTNEIHVMGGQQFGLEGNSKTNERARQHRQMNGYVLRSFLATGGPVILPPKKNDSLLGMPTHFGHVQYTPNAVLGQQYVSKFTEPLNAPLENNTILLGRAGIEMKSNSISNPYSALQFQMNMEHSQKQIQETEEAHQNKRSRDSQTEFRRQENILKAPKHLRPQVSAVQQVLDLRAKVRTPGTSTGDKQRIYNILNPKKGAVKEDDVQSSTISERKENKRSAGSVYNKELSNQGYYDFDSSLMNLRPVNRRDRRGVPTQQNSDKLRFKPSFQDESGLAWASEMENPTNNPNFETPGTRKPGESWINFKRRIGYESESDKATNLLSQNYIDSQFPFEQEELEKRVELLSNSTNHTRDVIRFSLLNNRFNEADAIAELDQINDQQTLQNRSDANRTVMAAELDRLLDATDLSVTSFLDIRDTFEQQIFNADNSQTTSSTNFGNTIEQEILEVAEVNTPLRVQGSGATLTMQNGFPASAPSGGFFSLDLSPIQIVSTPQTGSTGTTGESFSFLQDGSSLGRSAIKANLLQFKDDAVFEAKRAQSAKKLQEISLKQAKSAESLRLSKMQTPQKKNKIIMLL